MSAAGPVGTDHTNGSSALRPRSDLTDLELGVISLLQEDGRRAYRQMAKDLGTTEKHVRATVLRLQQEKVMTITAITFPALLGYRGMASIGIRTGSARPIADIASDLARIRSVDYVALTAGSYDMFIEVVCRSREELLDTINREIRTIGGIERIETFPYLHFLYQALRGAEPQIPPDRRGREQVALSDVDRDIIAQLSGDGRTPYQTIADRLGISEGQVRQRIRRLVDLGALRIVAIANPSTLGYDTMAWVGIRAVAPIADVAHMLSELPSTTYIAATADRFDVFTELVCTTEEDLMDELDRIRTSGHVAELESFLYLDLHYKRMDLT